MKYKFPLISACIVALTFIVPFAASTKGQVTVPQEVWIAVRTDGQPGTGTIIDPYDGSTEPKLDALMHSYYAADASNIVFHFGPGTFHTLGAYGPGGGANLWFLLDGWHIKGAGKNSTTFYQDSTTNPLGYPLLACLGGLTQSNNQSVEDMTIDCGYFREHGSYPNSNWSAVSLMGANATVRNVRVIHSGSDAGESFAILITNYLGQPTVNNALIDNCEVLECGASVSGLTMSTYDALAVTPIYARGGKITNNRVDGAVNGGGPPGGFDGGLFAHNVITNCAHGIYLDTFPTKNAIISDNVLTGCGNAIIFNAGTILQENTLITNNTLASESGVGFEATGSPGVVNAQIVHNRLISSGAGYYGVFLYGSAVRDTTVAANIIDASLPYFNTATNTTTCLNRTPACQPVPNVPDNCPTINPPVINPPVITPTLTPCSLP